MGVVDLLYMHVLVFFLSQFCIHLSNVRHIYFDTLCLTFLKVKYKSYIKICNFVLNINFEMLTLTPLHKPF